MKIVHKTTETINDLLQKAKVAEVHKDWEDAITAYQKIVKVNPLNEFAYQRLMILHRRNKDLKKELTVIRTGIKAFEDYYNASYKKSEDKKVLRLSKALLKSTGLADKKGNPLYDQEPIGKWNRRKSIVEKKLKQ